MRSLYSCAQTSVQAVQSVYKTVCSLCNFIVHFVPSTIAMYINHSLSPALSARCAPNYPLQNIEFNRGFAGFIPTIHSPNNKSCMDILDLYIEKLWKGGYAS
jgi:hypothetical protein